ncbi:MAG: ABC transporter permease [Clostridiales Family XIII bacterium]|nr:ABC transporter permease [Clostridiales Family XIII bacterium]
MKFILKRLAEFAVSIAALSFVVFSLLYLAPGDPAKVLAGPRQLKPELLDAIRDQYGLNDSFWTQYGHWLQGASRLDFGESIRHGRPVTSLVADHLSISIQLVLFSLILSLILGLVFGVISAKRRDKLSDRAINLVALVGTSAPSFAVGLLLLIVFSLLLGIFPGFGLGDGSFIDRVWHLALPAITLTIGVTALLIKITRSSMLSEVSSDYATFMRARSVSGFAITRAQLRNASAPILTSTGLILASLLGSTVLVETTFAIPGVGNLLASAVAMKDVPVVQYLTMLLSFFICLASAVVDIGVYFLNPQTRYRGRARTRDIAENGSHAEGGEI